MKRRFGLRAAPCATKRPSGEVRVHHAAQLLLRVAHAGERRRVRLEERRERLVLDVEEDLLLPLVVVVEAREREPRRLRDVADRRPVEAALREDFRAAPADLRLAVHGAAL